MTVFRHACRRLVRRPLDSLVIVVTLALGIGASTAVFSLVDSTLLRPAPFAHADRLVDVLDMNRRTGGGGSSLNPEKISGWRQQRALFEAFEVYSPWTVDVLGEGEPERMSVTIVSVGLMRMLGASPTLGRGFAEGDGRPGAPGVVIISDGLWRERFAGDADVLGRVITLNDELFTVIGVMPRRFRLFHVDERAWLPVDIEAVPTPSGRSMSRFWGIARLRPGVDVESAQAQANTIADGLQRDAPLRNSWDLRLQQKQVARVSGREQTALVLLLGAVACLMLVALANVSSLCLAHAASREGELAVRSALGASRRAVAAEIVMDGLVLGGLAGLSGIVLARWMLDAVLAAAPDDLAFLTTTTIELDTRVLAASVALTIATAIVVGLIPAIRGSRPDVDAVLRGTKSGGPRMSGYLSGGLVVVEVALSVVLLTAAVLMTRTVTRLESIDPGFELSGLVAVPMALPTDRYPDEAARQRFLRAVSDELAARDHVAGVAMAWSGLPRSGFGLARFEVEGAGGPLEPADEHFSIDRVSGGYFELLGIPLIEGRTFMTRETVPNAVVIDQSLAARLFPAGGAIGRRFRMGSGGFWLTVVGVARDVSGVRPPGPATHAHVYYPFDDLRWPSSTAVSQVPSVVPQRTYSSRTLIVRSSRAGAAVSDIEAAVWAVDPRQPVTDAALVSDQYRERFSTQRFVRMLMGAFGLIAMVLTAAGVLAVLSRVVAQRTREIAIRSALGATRADVFSLVMGRGMVLAVLGTLLGMSAALAVTDTLTALLVGVEADDPLSFAAAAVILLAAAGVACWWPTRRALAIQPAAALRRE